jgi:hypothetical protein
MDSETLGTEILTYPNNYLEDGGWYTGYNYKKKPESK